jgi:hypothetical protein
MIVVPAIPEGSIGIVGAVMVPCVRYTINGRYFNCVDFMIDGNKERAAYYNREIKRIK